MLIPCDPKTLQIKQFVRLKKIPKTMSNQRPWGFVEALSASKRYAKIRIQYGGRDFYMDFLVGDLSLRVDGRRREYRQYQKTKSRSL